MTELEQLKQRIAELESEKTELQWLLDKDKTGESNKAYHPFYGDVTQLNTERTILDAVGKETLIDLTSDLMDLLNTSVAVYEKNGDYAYGFFDSGWCQVLDAASRRLCNTKNNKTALLSGKWLCHEDCWNNSAKATILAGKPTDIDCIGRIKLYAEPIYANNKIIGAINIGYANPPKDEKSLKKLAETFQIDFETLKNKAMEYKPRPPFIIQVAKKRLKSIAKLIGEIVSHKQNEEKFEHLFQFMEEGFIRADVDGNIILANRAIAKICGYKNPDDLLGKHISTFYAKPKQRKHILKQLKKAGSIHNFEFLFRRKNGTTLWTLCTFKALFDRNGKFNGTEGIIRNIEERKQTQQALKERVKELTSLYRISQIAQDSTKPLDSILNDIVKIIPDACQFPEICGASIEYIGKKITSPNFTETSYRLSADIKTYNTKVGCLDVVYIPKLSKESPPVFLPEEEKLIEAIAERTGKIIERKLADDSLKDSEKRLELMLKGSNDALWDWDLEHNNVYYSPQWYRQLGYNPTELQGDATLWQKLMHPDDKDYTEKIFNTALKGKNNSYEVEFRLLHKNGHYISVLSRGFITRGESGKPLRITGSNMNLTNRNKSLIESEEKFRLLAENMVDMVALHKNDGTFVYVSPSVKNILGYSVSELIGTNPYKIFHPNDIQFIREMLHKPTINEKKVVTGEYRIRNKQGNYIWFHTTTKPVFHQNKGEIQLQTISRDITKQKQAEGALKESEKNLMLIIENIPIAVFAHDIDGKIHIVNKKSIDYTGYSRDELLNMTVSDIDKDVLSRNDREKIWKKIQYTEHKHFLATHHRKDGSTYPVEISLAAVVLKNKPILLALVQDITKRKQAEQDLLESREKYKTIFDNAPLGIFRSTPQGKFIEVNPALARMLGYETPEQVVDSIYDIAKQIYVKTNIRDTIVDETLKTQDITHYENIYRKKDGTEFTANLYLRSVNDENGNTIYLEGLVEDITQRKNAELELRRQERDLRKLNATKDKLFSIIAHDLKSPLNNVIGFASLLNERYSRYDEEKIKQLIKYIFQSAKTLQDLLENLLTWSRSQRNKIKITKQVFSVAAIANDCVELIKPQAMKKQIDVQNKISPQAMVFVDNQTIKTVLRNILTNAIKFTPQNGKVTLQSHTENENEIISIADTGMGMRPEQLEKLFLPDENHTTTGTAGEEGTGLGLIICKEFVEKNNGKIRVESQPGKGLVFYISLPVNE